MGANLDTLVNTKQLASSPAAYNRVADLVSSQIDATRLSPLLEKDEEDDWVDRGAALLDQEALNVKAFPSRTFRCPLISEGHRDVSPPKVPSFGMLGKANTFGETGTSKRADKVPLCNKPG